MFPAALGRGAVRTTLAATKAIGGAYVGGVGNAGAVVKTVGNTVINSVRNSGGVGVYRRVAARDDKSTEFQATAMMAFMWYWIIYHILTEPEHLYGHWIPPNPKDFTNAELGIPDIGDENPSPCDMRVRKERPRFLRTHDVDLYHEYYGGSRILPRRAAYANGAKDEEEEEEEEDDEC